VSVSLSPLTLVLGGQRSGKSAYGESLFKNGGVYLATGDASDEEMAQRIDAHQQRRGEGWVTVEEPMDLGRALHRIEKLHDDQPVLIDSLGMWVSNVLHKGQSPVLMIEPLVHQMLKHQGPIVVISDQVGLGIVPMNAVARAYIDALGLVNQITAHHANQAVLVTAGLAQILKAQN